MGSKYAVVLGQDTVLPERDSLISQAWGDVPVSYVQDQEIFSECSFLDLKINKWEVNTQWSSRQGSEPWIRIEILKEKALEEYLQDEGHSLPVEVSRDVLVVFELDEGGVALDEMLLLHLVSVFYKSCKVYKWCDDFQEVNEETFTTLPATHIIQERLLRCE
ncbi:hypothetical protein [Pseudomonas brassicacearum]|uniref:hypothetical protein n=1 Tax=Pseudomonas brassicacearum TaxID=930166 RepID=UPI00069D4848|nr:hypothetical protein [Pseudomonas brassicacearum]